MPQRGYFTLPDDTPGTADISLSLGQQIKIAGALIVTTLQEVALLDVRKTIALFKKMHVPIIGIIENMSFYEDLQTKTKISLFGTGGGERLADEEGVAFLAHMPLDPLLCECADKGQSIFIRNPENSVVNTFKLLAKDIQDSLQSTKPDNVEKYTLLNPQTLQINWKDGTERKIALADIQKLCFCARCSIKKEVKDTVSAFQVTAVGNYALRFRFSSGCSLGIYPFELLRRIS